MKIKKNSPFESRIGAEFELQLIWRMEIADAIDLFSIRQTIGR